MERNENGIIRCEGARLIDRLGTKILPIGNDGFANAIRDSVLVDKTMLIADVLTSGNKVTLFCRPRRFGKTLNMTMLKAFFERPVEGDPLAINPQALFAGTEVWEADGGAWRAHCGAYPVIHMSFNTVKKMTWEASYGEIKGLIRKEYDHHGFLANSPALSDEDRAFFARVRSGSCDDADYATSLTNLAQMLSAHRAHVEKTAGAPAATEPSESAHAVKPGTVILIDEYDAPVMAGRTNGYYREVVDFLKGWLTGALKDGGAALAFACLTGVQRISKESIFSDLNNLAVDTPLSAEFDERFGFSTEEVEALATYLGHPDCMDEAREWYDGYRFGNADVYNPWSVLNYLKHGCQPGAYWGNTSGNAVLGELVRSSDEDTVDQLYALLAPGGTTLAALDLGTVFPDEGLPEGDALWSMLYLAGYLTTDDTSQPNDLTALRELRIPNREVASLFSLEVIRRFRSIAGGTRRLFKLQQAAVAGDERTFGEELGRVARDSASSFDLTSEGPCHMLVLGLMFGVQGYRDPVSNRERGYGRSDISLEPDPYCPSRKLGPRPRMTLEVKYLAPDETPADADELAAALEKRAQAALTQIRNKAYDAAPLPKCGSGRVRWGVAFCGKRVAVACEMLPRTEQE